MRFIYMIIYVYTKRIKEANEGSIKEERSGNNMATILVDYENVGNANGLRGVDALRDTDTLIIFYSGCCSKIRYDYLQEIKESGCEFRIVKLKKIGKNALDFYIAAECGVVSERGERQVAIISNDKGFQAVIDFFVMDKETENIQIIRAGSIETALTGFTIPEETIRKTMLKRRMSLLDLSEEYNKIKEQKKVQRELQDIFQGTDYEERTAEIIHFVNCGKNRGKKELYTSSLHCFGRKDGTVIYRLLKERLDKPES